MLENWVLALAGSPLVFLALYVLATIDGFFPPIPSESAVIGLAALSVHTGEPNFWVLGAVAAAGAFSGDQVAYSIGKHLAVRRMRWMQGRRQRAALDWAEQTLARRGGAFIIAARYVPVGRVAVNMTAGAIGFSRFRFSGLVAIAAITWSVYSVMLGIGAGVWLGERPLVAILVGVIGGLVIGLAIDKTMAWVTWRRRGRPALATAVAQAVTGDGPAPETVASDAAAGPA